MSFQNSTPVSTLSFSCPPSSPNPRRDKSAAENSKVDTESQINKSQQQQSDGNYLSEKKHGPPPKGISESMWERFQLLRERKQNLSIEQHSRQRKRRRKKQGESSNDTASSRDSVQDLAQLPPTDTCLLTKQPLHDTTESLDTGDRETDPRLSWVNVKPYLGINDHLKGMDRGRHAAKTKLEEKIDKAISLRKFDVAEKLSDHLATREFGKEVADAFTAKRYAEKKMKEDDMIMARKKKKLDWGFDHKQRWETKGNM